ncbi:MAG: DUF4440 domain-containing protein [Steroidobacteraceae bacterium]
MRQAAVLFALFLSVFSAHAADTDDAAIRNAAASWITAFKSGALDDLMQLYDDDATIALHGQPVLLGKSAIREYFQPRIGTPGISFLLDIESISIYGDTAILLSRYWFEMPVASGSRLEDAGRSLLVYRRDDRGRWLIRFDIDQATPDATFPPPSQAQ